MNRVKKAIKRLDDASAQTSKFLDGMNSASGSADNRSSTILCGSFGGTLGTLTAIGIAHWTALTFSVIGGPLAALGILAGILICRGPGRILLERRKDNNSLLANEVLRRILTSPPNTPAYVIEELWEQYHHLNKGLASQTAKLLGTPHPPIPIQVSTTVTPALPTTAPANLLSPPAQISQMSQSTIISGAKTP